MNNFSRNRKIGFVGVLFLLCFQLLADELYDGPIMLKGRIDGELFSARKFNIEFADNKYVIKCADSGNVFHFRADGMVVRDVVISLEGKFAAVSLQSRNWETSAMALIILDSKDGVQEFDYKLHHLSDEFGWIVELAAISNDGQKVLAKCASMKSKDGANTIAEHNWTIITFEGKRMKFSAPQRMLVKWEEMFGSVPKKEPGHNSPNP